MIQPTAKVENSGCLTFQDMLAAWRWSKIFQNKIQALILQTLNEKLWINFYWETLTAIVVTDN